MKKLRAISRKKLYETLGFSGERLPDNETTLVFKNVVCVDCRGEKVIESTVRVLPMQTVETPRNGLTLSRVLVECPHCRIDIPFGRFHQHYSTKACERERKRGLENGSFGLLSVPEETPKESKLFEIILGFVRVFTIKFCPEFECPYILEYHESGPYGLAIQEGYPTMKLALGSCKYSLGEVIWKFAELREVNVLTGYYLKLDKETGGKLSDY